MASLLNMIINATTILEIPFFDDLGQFVLNLLVDYAVGPLLWALCDIFFVILDLFEYAFRAFAGTLEGGVKIQGEQVEGDIVLYLFQSRLVLEIFISVLVLSWFLLIIFTIFAVVKNQYSDKQEPVSKIINNSFKALLMYLLVPIATIVCLIVGNIVLQAIDGATKRTTSDYRSVSDSLFIAAAYNANKLRDNELKDCVDQLKLLYSSNAIIKIEGEIETITGITEDNCDTNVMTREKMDIIASLVDEHFASGTISNMGSMQWHYQSVRMYYDAFSMSYITIWVGGAFLIGALGKIVRGLISRIFKMTFYFAISPIIMATYPIDNGGALGKWRSAMVQNGTMALATVGVVNILYSLLPVFNNISIGTGIGACIIKLFVIAVAFNSAKDLISGVSGWFGTGDALSEGEKHKGALSKPIKSAALTGIGVYAGVKGGLKAADSQGKSGAKKFWAGTVGGFGATILGGKTMEEFRKAYEDKEKAGEATYKAQQTRSFGGLGLEDKKKKSAYETREAIYSENKRIGEKLDSMIAKRDNELAGLVAGSPEYEEIKEKWQKAMDKVKASASYLEALFADEQDRLEQLQKKNEKRQSNFAYLDSWEKADEHDKIYFEKVKNLFAGEGVTIDEHDWKAMKEGNFGSFVGAFKDKAQEIYNTFASEIASNEHEMQRAQQAIENLANSGKDGLEYLQKTFGTKIGDILKSTTIDGETTYQLKEDFNAEALSDAIKKEQSAINKAIKKWADDNDKMLEDKIAKYGTDLTSELETISRNMKNKS